MNKIDFLRSLSGVKVVIGNGFDLHCGLHTSYYNYFQKRIDDFIFIKNWFESFQKFESFEFNQYISRINEFNVWDVFFALDWLNNKSNIENRDWFDIEELMLSSLLTDKDEDKEHLILRSAIHWKNIADCYKNYREPTDDEHRFILNFLKKIKKPNNEQIGFYDLLLEQLKLFEKKFGQFIYWQTHNTENLDSKSSAKLNSDYLFNFQSTLRQLNCLSVTSVDSFNYSNNDNVYYRQIFHHINGDCSCPIFGIDSTHFKPSDERFVFTKTSRRIDADLISKNIDDRKGFRNVVIYGHSLNRADFSYFFPIFDKIKLLDNQEIGVVVFAFSIYNENDEAGIKARLRQGISNLIREYALSKGVIEPERFLDSLSTQNRIITYQIPLLENNADNDLNKEWKKVKTNFEQKIGKLSIPSF